jgi:mycothiol synthase
VRLRPPALADLEAIHEVIAARETADIGQVDITLANVADEWRMSEFDLMEDARVVTDERGRIIAYGLVRLHGALGMVHPEAEGGGAGSRLLGWLEDRERHLGRPQTRQYVASTNRSAERLLRARGYELARSSLRMLTPLTGAAPPPPAPAGVEICAFDVDRDLEAAHRVDDRAFASDPSYEPESVVHFAEEHVYASDCAPELSLVATDQDRLVGFLLSRRLAREGAGYVDVLAVDPDHQRRGVGLALLLTAWAAYADAGLRTAQLNVSSANPRALRLYESAGMTPRFRHDIYERPV